MGVPDEIAKLLSVQNHRSNSFFRSFVDVFIGVRRCSAQACRMPYGLVADGKLRELGDVKYLLSPQDLMAVEQVPELIEAGVSCFKIEGRLKGPEYVAITTQVATASLLCDCRERFNLSLSISTVPRIMIKRFYSFSRKNDQVVHVEISMYAG